MDISIGQIALVVIALIAAFFFEITHWLENKRKRDVYLKNLEAKHKKENEEFSKYKEQIMKVCNKSNKGVNTNVQEK